MFITILSLVLGSGYFLLMSFISLALGKLKRYREKYFPFISVVVAARNEEKNIEILLKSLSDLKHDSTMFEIILVDDDSIDNTRSIMEKYSSEHNNWNVLYHRKSSGSLKGKKGALALGIENSKGEIILTTDADCFVPENWIKSMIGCFKPDVGMVLGHSPVRRQKGFFNILQRFDTICESAIAAASSYINKPTHSNGRNLAFRKKTFLEVGGYNKISQISTGDDFFLSKIISTATKWKFIYNTDPNSFVTTKPERFGKKYIHQQLRRNSKAFYLTLPLFIVASWIFIFHVFLGILLFSIPISILFWILLGIKFIFELFPVAISAKIFNQKDLLKYFPLLWIIYPVIFLGTQLLGSLQFYRWK